MVPPRLSIAVSTFGNKANRIKKTQIFLIAAGATPMAVSAY